MIFHRLLFEENNAWICIDSTETTIEPAEHHSSDLFSSTFFFSTCRSEKNRNEPIKITDVIKEGVRQHLLMIH